MSKVYQELFTLFDRDGSDSVDPTELGNALRFIGCNPIDAEIETMLQEAADKGIKQVQSIGCFIEFYYDTLPRRDEIFMKSLSLPN